MATIRPTLTVSSLINDLENGITRCKGDTGYDPALGSIEEKYGLTKTEVKEIFKHEKLKNLRIGKQPSYVLVDDTVAPVATPTAEAIGNTNIPSEANAVKQESVNTEAKVESATEQQNIPF